MADFTQTVTNNLPLMAMSPAVYWNALTWGTDNWGLDGDTITEMDKGITNATSISTTIGNDFVKEPYTNTLDFSVALGKDFVKAPFSSTLKLTEDISSLSRGYGIWDYVFTKPTSDGDEAVYDVSAKVSDTSTTWTGVSDTSTTWTEA